MTKAIPWPGATSLRLPTEVLFLQQLPPNSLPEPPRLPLPTYQWSLREAGPSLELLAQDHSQVRGYSPNHREQGLAVCTKSYASKMGFTGGNTYCLAKLKAQTSHPRHQQFLISISPSRLQP